MHVRHCSITAYASDGSQAAPLLELEDVEVIHNGPMLVRIKRGSEVWWVDLEIDDYSLATTEITEEGIQFEGAFVAPGATEETPATRVLVKCNV
jgi:hypothetical protein